MSQSTEMTPTQLKEKRYRYVFLLNINFSIFFIMFVTCNPTLAMTTWPDTGQTKCYDLYRPITCPGSGQPFYGQDAQHNGQQPSYTKLDANGNALATTATSWTMVRDNVTGLTWEVKTSDGAVHDKDNTYYWCNSALEDAGSCDKENNTENFINTLNANNFGGYNDWRLPTVQELASLLNSATREPSINTSFFPNTSSDGCTDCYTYYNHYWTSTVKMGNSYDAWRVTFEDEGDVFYSSKSRNGRVRAVRGGNISSPSKYIDNHNGTITDKDSGLMWQQDPSVEVNGVSGKDYLDWEEALAYVASLNAIGFAGHSDWRLPNRNELLTLVDYSHTNPAVNTLYFTETRFSYWSSTTEYGVNERAFKVSFYSGYTSTSSKTISNYVQAVRTHTAFRLSVGKTGNGAGSVTSSPAGISCGNDCSETYNSGTTVSLTAMAGSDSIFTGWSGACSGTGSCIVTMNQSKSVAANFKNPSLVNVTLAPLYLLLLNAEK